MNDHFDITSFNRAVDAIPLMGFTTRIDRALRLAQKKMFTEGNGARDDVADLLVLLTDGSQTYDVDAERPGQVAEELRNAGVHILVIGIGRGTNMTELEQLAGHPEQVFVATSFKQLIQRDFIGRVKDRSCKLGKMVL